MLDRIADIAIFQRFDGKRGAWVDVDPPRQVAATLLSREGRWTVSRINGVITTPTLRPDGSLLSTKGGYDTTTQLYHLPSLDLPDLPDHPSREQALAALALLTDLLSEFSFVGPLDRAVALAGILTVLVRGSLQTAPMFIVRAHTPGTGKSYLVDVISTIATGRLCPVITASKSEEETEKRLGAVILSGAVDRLARQLRSRPWRRPALPIDRAAAGQDPHLGAQRDARVRVPHGGVRDRQQCRAQGRHGPARARMQSRHLGRAARTAHVPAQSTRARPR